MHPYESNVAKLMDELGLALPKPGHPEIVDLFKAESCYVHHSRVPTATVGYALVTPTLPKGRFPNFTFIAMMDKRSAMDEYEVCAVADLCGAEVTPPFWGNPAPFTRHLHHLIATYDLGQFFERDASAQPETPHEVRPIGSHAEIDSDTMKLWRSNFRKATELQRMMTVSILGLYNANACRDHWLFRMQKSWHAVDGLQVIRDGGALIDWAKLFCTYPGW